MVAPRRICWFSCGACSAVAARLTIARHGRDGVVLAYCDTSASEHPDNLRFRVDVEKWLGIKVTVLSSTKYRTVEQVFEAMSYMSGVRGAPCTVQLKKIPRFDFQRPDDIHIFGFASDELRRIDLFSKNNHDLSLEWPLLDAGVTRDGALGIVMAAGIKLPAMYRLGYRNNNCLGCVKATSPDYWNKIRVDFPEVFNRRVEQSRKLGVRLVQISGKRIFLDELSPNVVDSVDEDLSCGPQCGTHG